VCFVVFHSLQDHLRIGTRDLDQPISCRCKKYRQAPHAMMVLTISTFTTIAQTTALIITRSPHILMDGRPQHSHKDISQTQHHQEWKT
jgi:hypothetical protein